MHEYYSEKSHPSTKAPPLEAGRDWLPTFGIQGWSISQQDALLTSLVTGQPILLVGGQGAAKTLLTSMLARALDKRFVAADCSKAAFEDLVGFPSPRGLAEGRMEFVETPLSLMDKGFILLDELSRAQPANQNKYLEVIRNRSLMGRRIEGLEHVWAAMNPAHDGFAGTHECDAALLSRFVFAIQVPHWKELEGHQVLSALTARVDENDAPLLPLQRASGLDPVDAEAAHCEPSRGMSIKSMPYIESLPALLVNARNRFAEVWHAEHVLWGEYIHHISQGLRAICHENEKRIDLRCLTALHRAILARRCLSAERDLTDESLEEVGALIQHGFVLLQFHGGRHEPAPIEAIHHGAIHTLWGRRGLTTPKGTAGTWQAHHVPLHEVWLHIQDGAFSDIESQGILAHRFGIAIQCVDSPCETGRAIAALLNLASVADLLPVNGVLFHTLCRMEHDYLSENTAALQDTLRAVSLTEEYVCSNPYLYLCMIHYSNVVSRGVSMDFKGWIGGLRSYFARLDDIRDHAKGFVHKLEETRSALVATLREPDEEELNLFGQRGSRDVLKQSIGAQDEYDIPF